MKQLGISAGHLDRQRNVERGALTGRTGHVNVAAEQMTELAADRESQTRAAKFTRHGDVGLNEWLEESFHCFRVHSDARIGYAELNGIAGLLGHTANGDRHSSRFGELAR